MLHTRLFSLYLPASFFSLCIIPSLGFQISCQVTIPHLFDRVPAFQPVSLLFLMRECIVPFLFLPALAYLLTFLCHDSGSGVSFSLCTILCFPLSRSLAVCVPLSTLVPRCLTLVQGQRSVELHFALRIVLLSFWPSSFL